MTARQILSKLELTVGLTGSVRPLREAIEQELLVHSGKGPLECSELAERLEDDVRLLIDRNVEEKTNAGSMPKVVNSNVAGRSIIGSCRKETSDSAEFAVVKSRRLNIEPLLVEVRGLTFQQFETFGSRVLNELGASSVRVTPHSDDQGIDFYGILSIGEIAAIPAPFSKLAHDVRLRFAGQAKHYPHNAIGPSMVRELVGAISLARHKIFTKNADPFEELDLLAFNPLLAMLFTTGGFTSGARELAQKAGIVARSGDQLALFLADQGVGMHEVAGETVFDRDLFHAWLNP